MPYDNCHRVFLRPDNKGEAIMVNSIVRKINRHLPFGLYLQPFDGRAVKHRIVITGHRSWKTIPQENNEWSALCKEINAMKATSNKIWP